MKRATGLLMVALLGVLCCDAEAAGPQELAQHAIENASVMIVCPVDEEHGVGLLFAADSKSAYIVTAGHVVQSCARDNKPAQVTLAGASAATTAQVLKHSNSPVDLAVLSIPAAMLAGAQAAVLPPARLGDADVLQRGDELFALGQSWFTNITPERLARRSGATLQFESHSVRPGSSGGPLLNDRWQVVGLVRDIGAQVAEAISIDVVLETIKGWSFPLQIRRLRLVSAGDEFTCELTTSGEARCWDDAVIGRKSLSADDLRAVFPGIRLQAISVGGTHVCGIDSNGAAYCWGINNYGQLGNGSKSDSEENATVRVTGGLSFVSISAGYTHTCAVTADGQAYCWGAGKEGRLGNDSGEDSPIPVLVVGGARFNTISAGMRNTCGVTTAGEGYCWGGVHGTGITRYGADPPNAFVPERVPGPYTYAAISAAGYQSETCGLTTAGAVYCWGAADDDAFSPKSLVQSQVSGRLVFSSLQHGIGGHACGTLADGHAYCWGRNDEGQLGNGSTVVSATPVAVAGELKFASVTAGHFQSCGATLDGDIYCWGAQQREGVGSAVPVKIPGIE